MTSDAPLLQVKGLHAGYGNMNILSDVDVQIREGEPVALVGTNGSGKSTLLKTICGLIRPTAGFVRLQGRDISHMAAEKRVLLGIALVPESREVFTKQSVLANLRLGAYTRLRRLRRFDETQELEQVLSIFPALESRLKQIAGTLSGGEQQMLAIGRALMSRPELLLLDEPSMGLAPLMVKEIFRVLDKLTREAAFTLFLVEQNTKLALKAVKRGYVIERGRIVNSDGAIRLLEFINEAGLKYGKGQ